MIVYNNSAPKAVNNVGQFGATEGSIGAYKSAAEYAADAKYWALLSQTKYSSVEDLLAEVERLYAQSLLMKSDIEQLKNDFEEQNQALLGLIQSTETAIDNTNAATELSKEATQGVLAQLDIISNMAVQTTLLPPGSMATGSYDNTTGVFSFGIPEGQPGRDGTDGSISDISDVAIGVPVSDDYGFYVDKENGGLYRADMSDIANLVPSIRSISINGEPAQVGEVSFDSVTTFNGRKGSVVSQSGDYSVSQITGAAKSGDNSDITSLSGLTTALSIEQGGTGSTTASGARTSLGLGLVSTENILPITKGGTGGTTAVAARTNLGLGSASTEDIIPIGKGGTGSSSAENARLALVSAKSGDNYDITSLNNLTTALSVEQGGTGATNADSAWLNIRPTANTPLSAGPVNPFDAATKEYVDSINLGASKVEMMPYGTLQDVVKWVVPEVFPGSDDSQKLQAAADYAVTNKLLLVTSGNYTITSPVTIRGDLKIDATAGSFTFSNVDAIFRPSGANSVEIRGGKYTANSYFNQRPQVLVNDYTDALVNLPQRVIVSDTQCFNCGVGYIMVNCQDPTSVHVSVTNNYCKSDNNTDAYIAASGISGDSGAVYPYLTILGNTTQSVDISTPRKSAFHVTGNTFDVFMQSGGNQDIYKIGGPTEGGNTSGNRFINRNTESAAEIDAFTGGLETVFNGNTLYNVSVKLMTLAISGGPRVGLGGRSTFSDNVMRFEKNPLNDFGVWLRTSLVSITGNVIYYIGADDPAQQRIFAAIAGQTLDSNNNSFGGTLCAANVISGNVIQLVTGAISRSSRVQCVNPTDFAGSTFIGNVMFGGNGMVLDARPERNRNIWTGNYIASPLFNGEDVWRMQSAFVGSGNYIGSSYDNTVSGIPMISVTLPTPDVGAKRRVIIPGIKRSIGRERSLYLLYIRVSGGGTAPNYQTFIISSGPHQATDRVDSTDLKNPIDSRFNTVSESSSNIQSCFRQGYVGDIAESIVLEAVGTYDTSGAPTTLEYQIVPLTSPFPAI